MSLLSIAIPYHSSYGHTQKVAEFVAAGVKLAGCEPQLISVPTMTESDWHALDDAAAIIFGAPTYMGGISAAYKAFMDASSKQWVDQRWKNKIAGGFTNSGAYCGDKLSALIQINLFAMQHSMIWVGTGMKSPTKQIEPAQDEVNRLGSFLGATAFSTNDDASVTPPIGDLKTAELYGQRVAEITKQFTSR